MRVNSQDHSRSQVHMSKQLNGKDKQQQAETKIDMKTTETDCTYEITRLTQCLCFTTYVVITMKSPHLLSTVHDMAICTRSVQSSQNRRFHHYDSDCCLNKTWPCFHTDRIDRAAVSPTTLADLASASHTSSTRIPCSCPDLQYPAGCSSSFHLTSPRNIIVGLLVLTAVI